MKCCTLQKTYTLYKAQVPLLSTIHPILTTGWPSPPPPPPPPGVPLSSRHPPWFRHDVILQLDVEHAARPAVHHEVGEVEVLLGAPLDSLHGVVQCATQRIPRGVVLGGGGDDFHQTRAHLRREPAGGGGRDRGRDVA